ncbi:MAG: hypothetical protein HRT88_20550, partial [Lentisphaeraceae bacterium]|nr:hypothetical protein [Lentisphaeraceae bacterium]
MFKNDFDWQEFKESLGEDNYKRLYIPTTEDDYLSQQISNTLKLGIFRETLSYPVKSHEIIKINDIQQDGLFRYKGINGLRDFSLNDNPGNGTVQNSPPNRIKGELLLLDKQVELMWNKADNFNDKFKVLTFQSTRLLTLQAFDDANKRAMKEVMTSSLNKLMAEYNVPHVAQNLDLSGISSEALREAVHSNNIAGMCNEM